MLLPDHSHVSNICPTSGSFCSFAAMCIAVVAECMAFPAMVAARLTALADSVANSSSMPYSPMLSSKRLAALSNLSAEAAAC